MLSIRLSGSPAEVADAVLSLRELFDIAAINGLCPTSPVPSNVRVYLEVNH
jgi:hypothetical protein